MTGMQRVASVAVCRVVIVLDRLRWGDGIQKAGGPGGNQRW
jgi:hypothetical protein